jgi:cytochrome P450
MVAMIFLLLFAGYETTTLFSKPRFARKDTEVCGVRLKRGDQIMAMLIATNLDPAANERPENLDLARRPRNGPPGHSFPPITSASHYRLHKVIRRG